MDFVRSLVDYGYNVVKPHIFEATQGDPQVAHGAAVTFFRTLRKMGLDGLVLDNGANKLDVPFELSNAAGYNKDGTIPPATLEYMGFDIVVVGTVTMDPWPGNERPTIRRFPGTESIVNWQGLPGVGAKAVAKTLESYGDHGVPLTINFMSTPQKKGQKLLDDLKGTMVSLREVPYVSRFELNISCPNTHGADGCIDARKEYQQQLDDMLYVIEDLLDGQDLYLKISPDLDAEGLKDILEIAWRDHEVDGFTATNTTTNHNPRYIAKSPGKGGASGNAVYDASLRVQKLFMKEAPKYNIDWDLIACGGIDSVGRAHKAIGLGAKEIQLYTPMIFKGPKLIRDLRRYST
jgi:dihydroorotate dehydrogenase